MAKTGTLKDNATGEVIYPITLASNVYDESGNAITSSLPTIDERNFLVNEYTKSINLVDTYAKSGSFVDSGITYTANSDGTITMNGTSTSERWTEIVYTFQNYTEERSFPLFMLEKGRTYTFGAVPVSGSYSGTIYVIMQNARSATTGGVLVGSSKTFNDSDGVYRVWINAKSGVTCSNLKLGLMLVEGTQLPNQYYPYFNGQVTQTKSLVPSSVSSSTTLTKSTGNGTLVVQDAYRIGNIINLTVVCSCTGSTSAGGDIWKGTINYKPILAVRGVGFDKSKLVILYIGKDGSVGVRAMDAVSSGQSMTINISFVV